LLSRMLVVVPLTLCMSLASCSSMGGKHTLALHTFSLDPLIREASGVAEDWSSDAYLVSASLPIWLDGETPKGEITLSYRSESDRSIWLNLYIRPHNKGKMDVETNEGLYEGTRPPANPLQLPSSIIPSLKALEILSTQEVIRFLRENRGSVESALVLEYSNPFFEEEPVLWSAHLSSVPTMRFLTVDINAHTGELIRSFDPSNPEDAP
jgi:hypothetical protein